MGAGASKQRLRELEDEVKKLQGRLQDIPKKNEEIEKLTKDNNKLKRQMARNAITEKEEEIAQLKRKEHELQEQLKDKTMEIENLKKDKNKELQEVREQLEKKNASVTRREAELEAIEISRTRREGVRAERIDSTAEPRMGELLTRRRTKRAVAISAEPGRMSLSDVIDEDTEHHEKTDE